MSRRDDIKNLILNHERLLQKLEERRALYGLDAPPRIELEIEDIKAEIDDLRAELEGLEGKDENRRGSHIIFLLNDGLDTEEMVDDVRKLYKSAESQMVSNPDQAIEDCKKALKVVGEGSTRSTGTYEKPPRYTQGKCFLLMASIFLNDDRDLEEAKKNFYESEVEFGTGQWSHLKSLAHFGWAIALRKSQEYEEAIRTCNRAQDILGRVAPDGPNVELLKQAIIAEKSIIEERLATEPVTPPDEPYQEITVYALSSGRDLIPTGGTADVNLLSLNDYEQNTNILQRVTVDLTKLPKAESAHFILEVDEKLDKVIDGLNMGDWLLIQTLNTLSCLKGKKVAVLVIDGQVLSASLKTFGHFDDHYLLRAQSESAPSIVITPYRSSDQLSRISNYYKGYGSISRRLALDVQITGEVIGHIPRASIQNVTKPIIWRIPVLSNISAGLDTIVEEKVEGYLDFDDEGKSFEADFGVRVVGDSMSGDDILPEDIALIHQQPTVRNGEIAAIVIFTPNGESLGVLKRYYVVQEKRKDLGHVLLVSSNPSSEHLVVVPSGVNIEAIENLYARQVNAGKIITPKFFQDAEIAIAGKFVRVVKN